MTHIIVTFSFLILFCSAVFGTSAEDHQNNHEELVLFSPRTTDLGDWGEWERCPNDTFVLGMRLKTEPFQGPLDDTGLNGIQLLCGRLGESSRAIQNRKITSLVGNWGSWGSTFECSRGYAIGFQLRSEQFQENGGDNTAANNIRIYCSGVNGYLEGAGMSWGSWTALQLCPRMHVLCGLRTQVQLPQGKSDDTSLNNVDMECCRVTTGDGRVYRSVARNRNIRNS